jgi:hypothetical protein
VLDELLRPARAAPPTAPRRPSRLRPLLPGLLVALLAVVTLRYYGVGLRTQATYAGYLVGVVALPGILLWRAARGRAGPLAVDLAGGVAVGHAVEIFSYLLGRAAGFPYGHVAAAAAVLVAFAAPPLRRHWRGSGDRTPPPFAWSVAGLAAFLIGWAALAYFRVHGLAWPASGTPSTDMAFHQALTGELRHHLPARFPYVDGVPLSYHWFVHADWAAATWATGIEPHLVTFRLGTLPVAILSALVFAVVIREIVGGPWWTGPLGAAFALLVVAPDPAPWSTALAPPAYLPRTMWLSPTQTFAGLLFAALMLVLVGLLRGSRGTGGWRLGDWALFALLCATVSGAKATFLPLLLAALALVALVAAVRRGNWRTPAIATGVVLVALVAAQLTLYRQASGGLLLRPFESLRAAMPTARRDDWGIADVAAVWALCWAGVLGAGAVLLRRRRLADPPLLLCAGLGVAGLGAVLLCYQNGSSHLYFLQSARPYIAAVVVAGLAAAVSTRVCGVLSLAAVAGGVALAWWLDRAGPAVPPARGGWALVWPYAMPLLAAAALAAAVWLARPVRGAAAAAGLLLLAGASAPASAQQWLPADPRGGPLRDRVVIASPLQSEPVIPAGAERAGRWIRAHTPTGAKLASNNHCRFTTGQCDPRQFWVSGFAERRVLIEGWAYTPPANAYERAHMVASNRTPYWDPALLAANDAAFTRPSPATVGVLRVRYGVSWLVVDARRPYDRARLAGEATLRFTAGDVRVYELVNPA